MAYFLTVYDKDGNVSDDKVATTNLSTIVRTIIARKLKDGEYSVKRDVTAEAKKMVEDWKKE
ncbi:MAG: hypothetical protein F4X32_06410 [Candidatus Dadabacteria bacterium]|nr:hypothetical protein [Candidatus Dadabacteria bacterium]MYB27113.1 hypothetical protein [Candidatus Dadabacteria bacterium]